MNVVVFMEQASALLSSGQPRGDGWRDVRDETPED